MKTSFLRSGARNPGQIPESLETTGRRPGKNCESFPLSRREENTYVYPPRQEQLFIMRTVALRPVPAHPCPQGRASVDSAPSGKHGGPCGGLRPPARPGRSGRRRGNFGPGHYVSRSTGGSLTAGNRIPATAMTPPLQQHSAQARDPKERGRTPILKRKERETRQRGRGRVGSLLVRQIEEARA